MSNRFTVTYHLRCPATDVEARAQAIAVEQSVEMPLAAIRDPWILSDIVGSVEDIADMGSGLFAVQIGLATATVGGDAGQLLNMVFGNTSLYDEVMLVDVVPPESLTAVFGGPRHDVAALRRRLGLPNRALTGSALKPQGLPLEQLALLAERMAQGGLDFVKDDHGLGDQGYGRFTDRLTACAAGVTRGAQSTGHPTRYIPSITGDLTQMRRQIEMAQEVGVDCVMIAPMICGFPTMQTLRRSYPQVTFFAHPSMAGAARISPALLIGRLFRLIGADAVIFPSFGGRFGYSMATCRDLIQRARCSTDGMKAALPVPAGGLSLQRIGEFLDFYGPDTMLLIGGSLLMAGEQITAETERFVRQVADHITPRTTKG